MEGIIGMANRFYMPSLEYIFEDQAFSVQQIGTRMGELASPFISYVNQENPRQEQITTEDSILEILKAQEEDEEHIPVEGKEANSDTQTAPVVAPVDRNLLGDFQYLLSHFYTVDSTTEIDSEKLNGNALMAENMKLNPVEEDKPQVLIYHTHSQEAFADSNGDVSTTIVGAGAYLSKLLNEKYQIHTIHHPGVYDLIDGKLDRSKAYQLSEQGVRKILEENPTIEVVIDLHRDGVNESKHLVTNIHNKPTAQIMFFNGLSHTKKNQDIAYLANPYIQQNLAFSLQMQVAAKEKYPEFVRPIYLKGYRYNMHLRPKTLLIEAGAQTNTVEEMYNAMEITAEILDGVLKP